MSHVTTAGAADTLGHNGYLQAGETIEAGTDGIGTLTMPVVAGPPLPGDLTGPSLNRRWLPQPALT